MEQGHRQTPENNPRKWQGEITEFERMKRELPWMKDQQYYSEMQDVDKFILREIFVDSKDPREIIELAKELRQECNGIGYVFLDDRGESIGYFYDIPRDHPEDDPEFQGEGPIRFIEIDYLTKNEDESFTTTRILYRIHYRTEEGQA